MIRAFSEGLCSAGAGMDAAGMRIGQTVFAGIVDGVDEAGLSGIRCGGQGEVGVATGGFEDGEFVVDSTVFSLGVRVVEGPVAMDEAVAGVTVLGVGEQTVRGQVLDSFLQEGSQALCGVVGMVEMDFYLATGSLTKGSETGYDVLVVLFNGVKKGVPGPAT